MNKLLKTVILAGSLLTATVAVSFADDAKTADKAPAAGSGSAAAPAKGKTATKAAPKGSTAKGSGASK